MNGARVNKPLIYLLLIVLQLTMLQWSMQVNAAVPGNTDTHMAACDASHANAENGVFARHSGNRHDCCNGHMSLDCQYHCAAGAFAFVGQADGTPVPFPDSTFPVSFTTIPDSVSVRSLFRPPRRLPAV